VSLTGLPLLVVSILAALGAFAVTIWSWRRGRWWRPVTRTVGVLACEALVLFTVGLVTNRSLDIFPSWSALLDQDRKAPPPTVVAADPTTKLDDWLRTRAVEGTHNGLVFEWRPADTATWHLTTEPVVYVPPRYFSERAAHFPVVLVVAPGAAGPGQGAWDPHKVNLLVPRSDTDVSPAVIVFLRTDHPDPAVLTAAIPKMLDGDLRTIGRGWAVVGIGADAEAGLDALTADPLRFWSAVAVADNTGILPKGVGKPRSLLDWQSALSVEGEGRTDRPEHGRPQAEPSTAPSGSPAAGVQVVAPADARLAAALRWAYGRLPAPVAPPLSGPVDPNAPPPAAIKAGQ
jgi:hypothetical protein